LAFVVAPPTTDPKPGQLVVVAGVEAAGYSGDGGQATEARIDDDASVAVLPDGTLYFAGQYSTALRRVNTAGVVETVPTVGEPDHFNAPKAVAATSAGVLYVATYAGVQRANPDGTFTVIAGGGRKPADEGGPATGVQVFPEDLAVADDGTVYLVENTYKSGYVYRITPDGTITTIARDLAKPRGIAVDGAGDVYFTDDEKRTVSKIAPGGAVSTVLGQETESGFAGDGGPAAKARFGEIGGIATDGDGNLYLADRVNGNVRVIDENGVIDTIGPATTGLTDVTVAPNGDLYLTAEAKIMRLVRGTAGAPAGQKLKPGPARWTDQDPGAVVELAGTGHGLDSEERYGDRVGGLAAGPDGTVYYTDGFNSRVYAIRPDGRREVFAGSSQYGGFSGDGGPAGKARLNSPNALATGPDGSVYVVDSFNKRVRKISPKGTISTIAGNGKEGVAGKAVPNGDGGPATAATVNPTSIAVGADGSVYLGDELNDGRIRRVDPHGTITTIAGGGKKRMDDATSPADVSMAGAPGSLAVDQSGNVYFYYSYALYMVGPDGAMSPVAGDVDEHGYAGDGGPATQARLNGPSGVAVGPDGTRYLVDSLNNRVRAVRGDGVITTVAGNGSRRDAGDGGPAAKAALAEPELAATDAKGRLFIGGGSRIREVAPDGTITTVATLGMVVDGDPARTVIDDPSGIGVDPAGTVYVVGQTPLVAVPAHGRVKRLADPPPTVEALAGAPDGSVYVATGDRVDRVYPDGAVVTVAGGAAHWGRNDGPMPDANGKRATSAVIEPSDVAVGPSGELYVTSGTRVYRLTGDGVLRSIVDIKGLEHAEYTRRLSIAAHDDVLYLADRESDRVFRVEAGKVTPFAGDGTPGTYNDPEEGDDAVDTPVPSPQDLAVSSDGTVYIATTDGIRRVNLAGELDTVVPRGAIKGGYAASLAMDAHDNLYFTSREMNQVRVVVRPGEMPGPFPWSVVWWCLAGAAVVGVALLVVRRRQNTAAIQHDSTTEDTGQPASDE
jgi:sugar lactone lactonase YvrE